MSKRFPAICLVCVGAWACGGTVATADAGAADAGPDTVSTCPSATGPAGFYGSCASVDALVPTCEEYTGLYWSTTATDLFCKSDGGKFSATEHCPSTTIGKCLTDCGQPVEELHFVYGGTEATASVACETIGHGKWFK